MDSMMLKGGLMAMLIGSAFSQGQGQGSQKQVGDVCMCRYGTDDGFDGVFHYFETPLNKGKCTDGGEMVCLTELDDGTFGEDFPGTCQNAACVTPLDDSEGKITICHRTCAENNPWVRITIDANAWSAHSCGHTTETCNGKDLAYWEPYQQDYILKEHGTRAEVAEMLGNDSALISEYWKHWEPACPAVRNGKCCDFDGEYGYSCCRRAVEDPPMDASFTASPVAAATLAPVAATTLTPVAATTLAPVPPPDVTLAPGTDVTPAPVAGPDDTLAPAGGGEPPQCFNRRLQDMEERWSITAPVFRYQQSLSFHLDFEVSNYIVMENMVSHTLMDATCTNSYTGAGLLHTRGLRLPASLDRQKIGVAVWMDSQEISQDDVYSEGLDEDNQMMANVDFCVRFALHTPPDTSGGSMEVNYLEVLVSFDVDLTDGFSIGTLTAEARDRCEKEADVAFQVEGYFCNDGSEPIPLTDDPELNQGDQVKVCVRPLQNALDQGIRMRDLQEFTWSKEGTGIQQEAIVNYEPASNFLTAVHCTRGYAICHFETLLFATFYQGPGRVVGQGVADLQFGGEDSQTSVSPKGRRTLQETENSRRQLQAEEPATAVEFALGANIGQPRNIAYSSSSSKVTYFLGYTAAVVASLLAVI